MSKYKLVPEMIPQTSFFTNLRSLLKAHEWDSIRKQCYKDANYLCEICGGRGENHPVECHEVWKYNKETKIQKLKRCIALCPACHEVVHIGLAGIRGRYRYALKHLMKVNNIDKQEAEEIIYDAWRKWERRNKIKWKLDISRVVKKIKNKDSLISKKFKGK